MIDLHCHILPALDDGPSDVSASLAMARAAVLEGVRTVVATPHVSSRYPLGPDEIEDRVDALNGSLGREGVALSIRRGAEIAADRVPDLDDRTLHRLALDGSDCVLLESPYSSSAPFMDEVVFDLQLRGFRPLLAHPERSPYFQRDVGRVARLVERGALCSVTAGSMAGRFGGPVRKFSTTLLRERLVHSVDSDAHDHERRPPGLRAGFAALEPELPGISAHAEWFTQTAPAAILAGGALPGSPPALRLRPSGWRRLLERPRTSG